MINCFGKIQIHFCMRISKFLYIILMKVMVMKINFYSFLSTFLQRIRCQKYREMITDICLYYTCFDGFVFKIGNEYMVYYCSSGSCSSSRSIYDQVWIILGKIFSKRLNFLVRVIISYVYIKISGKVDMFIFILLNVMKNFIH